MSPIRFTVGTTDVLSVAQEAPTPAQIREQVREQIRQSIQDAVQQAREGAQEMRDAQQGVRDAQQQVREAQQEVRNAQQQLRGATRAGQRGAAEQTLAGAQAALRDAEAALRDAQAQVHGSHHIVYSTGQLPPDFQHIIPPQAVDLAIGFFITCAVIIIGWPIARVLGRRIERPPRTAAVDSGIGDHLQRIEQAVEAMSIEIERISESQRFMTKLRTGSAQPHAGVPERR
jgi:TPP-dependent trihydroxycyclohexane-1,2-dione (THcHDO) dehydratase